MMIEQIKYIQSQVKSTETEIDRIMKKLNSLITTIPGVGKILGAVILGEIGDISKFDSPKKLVAFAGIDATVRQSGEFEGTQNKMSNLALFPLPESLMFVSAPKYISLRVRSHNS